MSRSIPILVLRVHAFIRQFNRYPTDAEVRKLANFGEAGGIARLCEAVAYMATRRDGPKVKPVGPVTTDRLREALHAAAEQHGIPPHRLVGPDRDAKTVLARQDAYARCRALGASTTCIGEFFARDHSTIIAGLGRHAGRAG